MINVASDQTYPEIRAAVAALCARFPGAYWRKLDSEKAYPTAFVQALTQAGFRGGNFRIPPLRVILPRLI